MAEQVTALRLEQIIVSSLWHRQHHHNVNLVVPGRTVVIEDLMPRSIHDLRLDLEELPNNTDLEAEIAFRTAAGIIDQVTIRLINENDQALVERAYGILQLDSIVVADFIQEAAFPLE